jgi:hypothetical protein
MKKASPEADDLLPEYDLGYAKAKPNRFATGKPRRTVVVLDEDLLETFTTPESVNRALRALLEAIPTKPSKDAA